MKQLQELATAGFAKAEEEWGKTVLAWGKTRRFIVFSSFDTFMTTHFLDKRQEKIRQETAEGSGAGTNSAGPTRHPTEEMEIDGEESKDQLKDKESKDKDKDGNPPAPSQVQAPPAKRYRLTEAMKAIIWEMVVLSNECCRLENERKCGFFIVVNYILMTIFLARLKTLLFRFRTRAFGRFSTKRLDNRYTCCSTNYQKNRWWLHSLQAGCLLGRFQETVCIRFYKYSFISRPAVSAMKKKLEKEAMEQGDND